MNIHQDSNVFVAHTDVQKAEALCDFFSSVFVEELFIPTPLVVFFGQSLYISLP